MERCLRATMNSPTTGLILSPEHWAQMEADISSRMDEEACGLILGTGNHSRLVVPITNILHDPHRFRMDAQEELSAFLIADEKGWEILAVYHSHPHGIDSPSPTDVAELTFPGIFYLIWYQADHAWNCRGYLMERDIDISEIPVRVSTDE